GRLDALVELFASDGRFIPAEGGKAICGRTQLRAFYTRATAGRGPSVHVRHSHLIEFVDVERAFGIVQVTALIDKGRETVRLGMRYHDEYVQTDRDWRFAMRTAVTVYL